MKKEKGFNKYTIIKNRCMHLFFYSYKNNNIILTIKEKWRKRGKNMRKNKQRYSDTASSIISMPVYLGKLGNANDVRP